MSVSALIGEFLHEAENTRKLLKAVPDSALNWKPSEKNWTTAELASHIAAIYAWYPPALEQDVFDFATFHYDREDYSQVSNIVDKFEENYRQALDALESTSDESLADDWTMQMKGVEVIPTMPRAQAVRNLLFNHIYHHRGELIVYLRATGNTVPGLYGPTVEDRLH